MHKENERMATEAQSKAMSNLVDMARATFPDGDFLHGKWEPHLETALLPVQELLVHLCSSGQSAELVHRLVRVLDLDGDMRVFMSVRSEVLHTFGEAA
jgi:hypothetical protein